MAKKSLTKVTTGGINLLLWAIVAFVVIDVLAKFGLIDLTDVISPIFVPTVASLFILLEIGIMQVITRKKKLDGIQAFGLTTAIIGLITVILSIVGVVLPQLQAIQGFVGLALAIFVVIEIFKKS